MNAVLVREISDARRDLRQWLYRTDAGHVLVSHLPDSPHVAADESVTRSPETLVWPCDPTGGQQTGDEYDTQAVDPVEALAQAGYEVTQ